MERNSFQMYTIYYDPEDFPGKFVVRGFTIGQGKDPIPDLRATLVCDTLHEARQAIPWGGVRIARSQDDVASVVESWV